MKIKKIEREFVKSKPRTKYLIYNIVSFIFLILALLDSVIMHLYNPPEPDLTTLMIIVILSIGSVLIGTLGNVLLYAFKKKGKFSENLKKAFKIYGSNDAATLSEEADVINMINCLKNNDFDRKEDVNMFIEYLKPLLARRNEFKLSTLLIPISVTIIIFSRGFDDTNLLLYELGIIAAILFLVCLSIIIINATWKFIKKTALIGDYRYKVMYDVLFEIAIIHNSDEQIEEYIMKRSKTIENEYPPIEEADVIEESLSENEETDDVMIDKGETGLCGHLEHKN